MISLHRLHLRRLLVAPRVAVAASTPAGAEVRVDGLVCGVCALRTAAALRSVRGVQDACVDLDAGRATLSLAPGAVVDPVAMQRALERVVIAMPLRRRIERLVATLRTRRWRPRSLLMEGPRA